MVPPELRELEERVAREDEDGALHLLLALWAEHRSPAIAQALEALSPRFLRRHPPLCTSQRWHKVAQARDPASVEALLSTPWTTERASVLHSKLVALAEFPPDPRIEAFALEVQAGLSAVGSLRGDRGPVLVQLERLLAHHGVPDPPREDPLEGRELPLGRLASSLEEELLQRVFAAPSDDGPRHVYADYLLSREDPLGPHLARSVRTGSDMEGTPTPLLAWWARQLFGEFSLQIQGYRRGFPFRASCSRPMPPEPTDAWATLEELSLYEPDPRWLAEVELPHLSVLALSFSPMGRDRWVDSAAPWLPRLPVRTLQVEGRHWSGAVLGRPELWPRLQTLRLTGRERLRLDEAVLGSLSQRPLALELVPDPSPLGAVLAETTVEVASRDLTQAFKAAGGAARSVYRVRVQAGEVAVDLVRDGEGAFRALRLSGVRNAHVLLLSQLLQAIPPGAVDRLEVERPPGSAGGFETRVRRALARYDGGALTFCPPCP